MIGYLGEVHPEVCDNYNIGTKAYIAVLDMPEVESFLNLRSFINIKQLVAFQYFAAPLFEKDGYGKKKCMDDLR